MRLALGLWLISTLTNVAGCALSTGPLHTGPYAAMGDANLASLLLLIGSFICVLIGRRRWIFGKRGALLGCCAGALLIWLVVFVLTGPPLLIQ